MSEFYKKKSQNILKSLGFYKSIIDGDWGKKSHNALLALAEKAGFDLKKIASSKTGHKYKTVCLTAGHGGRDKGAVNGLVTESEIACDIRNITAFYLRKAGITVITDGEGRENLPLRQAYKLIKDADIAFDIHTNAHHTQRAHGVEALAGTEHKEICKDVCSAIAGVLDTTVRGSEGGWKDQGSGQHSRLAYVQRGGIVLETFFISNPDELKAYQDKKWVLGKAIAQAILDFENA